MEFKAEPETFKEGLRTRSSGKPREESIPRRRTGLLVYRIRTCTGRLGFAIMRRLVSSAGAGQQNRGSRSPGADTGEWRGNGESQGRPLSSSLTLKEERVLLWQEGFTCKVVEMRGHCAAGALWSTGIPRTELMQWGTEEASRRTLP